MGPGWLRLRRDRPFGVARRPRVLRRRHGPLRRAVRELLERTRELLEHHAPAEAAVERRAIEDERVLNVVPGVAHHGDRRVVAGGQLLVTDEVDRTRLHERRLLPYQDGGCHMRTVVAI